jgi:hypothetical protein
LWSASTPQNTCKFTFFVSHKKEMKMRANWLTVAMALVCGWAAQASAQVPEREQRGPNDSGGFPGGPPPVMQALDTNANGEVSAEEIENAATALKSLDKNKDGKLTGEELIPNFGGEGVRGGFVGGFGRGFGGREGGFGGPVPNAQETIARWLSWDKNADGKLTIEEVPDRLQGLLTHADADKNGMATKKELAALAQREARGAREGFGGRVDGFGGLEGPGEQPGGFGGPAGPGGFGRPNRKTFVDRALKFDADKDGKLSKEELGKLAEQYGGSGFGREGDEGRTRLPRTERPESDN